jgi:hemolysin activation/secretion protein
MSFALEAEDLAIFRAGERLRDERLRMLETGLRASWRNGGATQSVASAELVKGLGGLGSGLTALDLTHDSWRRDFLLMRMSFIRLTQLGARWSVRLDAFAQQSNHVLPYSERFKIGGDRLGRGFEVAEIAGDQGVGAKVQIDRHVRRAPALFGRTSVYGFYDIAATWKETVPGRESAASAGMGVSVRRGKTRAALELAQPLTHADVEGRKDLSLFVEITLQL